MAEAQVVGSRSIRDSDPKLAGCRLALSPSGRDQAADAQGSHGS
jgi:hypothetical protein